MLLRFEFVLCNILFILILGRKYDEAAERPLLASQQRETNSAPDELKFSRPTKQFDLNERSVGQMNGDLGK